MTGDLDPLAAVRADAARLDALAAADPTTDTDPALLLLTALRGEIDAAVADTDTPALRRDAALLDALAAGTGLPASADPAVGLLQALRAAVDGVTVPAPLPAPALPAPALPAVPLTALADRASRRRRRALRTGVAAGSVALALSMSGVAAAAFDSHPGGALYGLRTQTFGRTDDDPVAAEQVLSDLQREAAAATRTPDNPAVVAKARALATQLHHYLAAEHDPVAQRSIAASAATVVTTVDALPVPVTLSSRSPHPAATVLAGRSGASLRPSVPADQPSTVKTIAVPLEPSPTPGAPDASPGSVATPSPADSVDPTGTPTTPDSPTATPSSSSSAAPTDSTDPGATPSVTPSDSASASPSVSPSDSPSATTSVKAAPVHTTAAVKTTRPKAKPAKKKKVTATLMTAQLPSSGLPQR